MPTPPSPPTRSPLLAAGSDTGDGAGTGPGSAARKPSAARAGGWGLGAPSPPSGPPSGGPASQGRRAAMQACAQAHVLKAAAPPWGSSPRHPKILGELAEGSSHAASSMMASMQDARHNRGVESSSHLLPVFGASTRCPWRSSPAPQFGCCLQPVPYCNRLDPHHGLRQQRPCLLRAGVLRCAHRRGQTRTPVPMDPPSSQAPAGQAQPLPQPQLPPSRPSAARTPSCGHPPSSSAPTGAPAEL